MDDLLKLITQSYGIIGLILISPMAAMIYLWKDNKRLQQQVIEAQVQRVNDAREVTERLINMTSEYAGLNKETNIALDRLVDLLEKQTHAAKRGG